MFESNLSITAQEGITKDPNGLNASFLLLTGFVFLILGFASFIGNIAVGYTFCRYDTLRESAGNTYIVNLATMNAIISCLSVRIGIEILTQSETFHLSYKYCNVEGFLVSSVHINVMMTIALIVLERYVVVCRFHDAGKFAFFHEKPLPCLLFSLFYSFIWSSPPLTELVPNYNKLNGINSCMFDFSTQTSSNELYIIGMMIFVCIVPFAVMIGAMVPICKELTGYVKKKIDDKSIQYQHFKRTKFSKTLANFDSCNSGITSTGVIFVEVPYTSRGYKLTTCGSEEIDPEKLIEINKDKEIKREIKKQKRKTDKKIMKSLATMSLCYVISWLPISVIILVQMLGGVITSQYVIIVSLMLAKTSCIHSTVIYTARKHKSKITDVISCTRC